VGEGGKGEAFEERHPFHRGERSIFRGKERQYQWRSARGFTLLQQKRKRRANRKKKKEANVRLRGTPLVFGEEADPLKTE